MRMGHVLFGLVMWSATLQAQESPQAIIDRAIKAHGGREKLAAIRAEKVKLQGHMHVGTNKVPFVNEMIVQLPAFYRSSVTIENAQRKHTITHILNGEQASIYLDEQPQPVLGSHLRQLKQTLQLEQAMRLVPLLDTSRFTLHALPEIRYNNRVLVGVRISTPSQRDLKLYFDKPSGLVVKSEIEIDSPNGKSVRQEGLYGGYREMNGHLRPTKINILRDGKPVMETTILEVQRLDSTDSGTP